jgi:hypothetical protein
MPFVQVYAVDFSQGNLVPSVDTNGWGVMRQGNSGPNNQLESSSDPKGLNLSVSAEGSPAANGVHLVLGQGVLPLKTRLLMHV